MNTLQNLTVIERWVAVALLTFDHNTSNDFHAHMCNVIETDRLKSLHSSKTTSFYGGYVSEIAPITTEYLTHEQFKQLCYLVINDNDQFNTIIDLLNKDSHNILHNKTKEAIDQFRIDAIQNEDDVREALFNITGLYAFFGEVNRSDNDVTYCWTFETPTGIEIAQILTHFNINGDFYVGDSHSGFWTDELTSQLEEIVNGQ